MNVRFVPAAFQRLLFLFVLTAIGFLFMPVLRAQAQGPAQIVLDKQYKGSLDEVLYTISFDKRLIFSYNSKKFSGIFITENTAGQKLGDLLDRWCKQVEMEWYIGEDNRIMIVGLGRTPVNARSKLMYQKTYKGEATAKNILVSGKVTDIASGEAIPFASVYIPGTTRGLQTNQDGFFTFQKVPTDTTTIAISSVGYKTGFIFLTPDQPKTDIDVKIEPFSIEIEQVEVTAQKTNIMRTAEKISNLQVTPKKLADLPNLGERDLFRSLQLMPGVSAANESSSGLYVRGGTPDQNLILYDGFTVYHVDHLYGFYSAFNPNAVKDVQLYKGGFESKYAGRLSSVTEITGKDGNSEMITYGGDVSLLSTNLYGEFPIGRKINSLIAFRKSYRGPIYNKIFDKYNTASQMVAIRQPMGPGGRFGNNYAATVSSYFYDLNTKISYKPGKKDILSFSLYNGTDNLDNSMKLDMPDFMRDAGRNFSSDNIDLTEYGNLGSSLKWSRRWNSKFYSNSLISYSNYFSNRDRTNNRTMTDASGNVETFKMGTIENNDLRDFSFHTNFTVDLMANMQLEFGSKLTRYDIAYDFSQNDTTVYLDISSKGNLFGGYLQSRISLMKGRLKLVPGIHTTWYGVTRNFYREPRFSVVYSASDKMKLTGAWGKYYQFANRIMREDILSGSRDFWILSNNDNIPVGEATHYIIGTSYENQKYLLSAEAYYKNLQGLSEYTLRFNPGRPGPGPGGGQGGFKYEQNFYTGKGYATGLELLAQKLTGNLTGWASYTFAKAMNQFDVYGTDYFPASNDVTHEFKLVSIYKWKRFSFSGTMIYATGRPYTAPEGGYTVTLLDGTEKSFISAGTKNSRRLPDYNRLDLGVNYFLLSKDKKTERGSISLSLFNVYNRLNVWYKEYQVVEDQLISIDKRFLGFTPNLCVTLKLD